jgi:acyl-CoA dehydrogenase
MPLDPDTLSRLLDTVERFVREKLVPREEEVERTDRVPPDVIAEMRALGLFGLSIPVEYGGLGLSLSEEMAVGFLLGGAEPAFRSVFGTNNRIGSQGLLMDGTPEQKARYLPRLASCDIIGSFALTEAESGSDAAALKSQAVREGDEYVLNGAKRFITNAPHAGLFTVFARTNPDAPDAKRNLGIPRRGGHAGSQRRGALRQDGAARLAGRRRSLRRLPGVRCAEAGRGRGGILHSYEGARSRPPPHRGILRRRRRRLIADALRYALERKQFGRPIADFQLIQAMLSDSKAESFAARAMVESAARTHDASVSATLEASCAKMFASEIVGGSPTAPCRSMAARATSRASPSNASTATFAYSAYTKARRKSSSSG